MTNDNNNKNGNGNGNGNSKPKKINVFQRVGKGVKMTFGIKDITPEQKAEKEQKKKEEQAYRQEISARQKQAWQTTYKTELVKQRNLYAEQQDKEIMARARAKAKADVQAYAQPKSKVGFFGKVTSELGKAFPVPSPKVQAQLDKSIGLLSGTGTRTIMKIPKIKVHPPKEIFETPNVWGDIPSGNGKSKRKRKVNNSFTKEFWSL